MQISQHLNTVGNMALGISINTREVMHYSGKSALTIDWNVGEVMGVSVTQAKA